MNLLDSNDKQRVIAAVVTLCFRHEQQLFRDKVTRIVSKMVGLGCYRIYPLSELRNLHKFKSKAQVSEVKWLPNGFIAINVPEITTMLSLRVHLLMRFCAFLLISVCQQKNL